LFRYSKLIFHDETRNLDLLDVSQKPYYLLFCIQRWLAFILDLMVMVLAVVLMILVVKLVSDSGLQNGDQIT
jgi:hypothetical protein